MRTSTWVVLRISQSQRISYITDHHLIKRRSIVICRRRVAEPTSSLWSAALLTLIRRMSSEHTPIHPYSICIIAVRVITMDSTKHATVDTQWRVAGLNQDFFPENFSRAAFNLNCFGSAYYPHVELSINQ